MAQITERREVRVQGESGTFVFAAEPEQGRLVIREERGDDESEELCALTIADRDELSGFLQGLRRVLGVEDTASRPEPPIEQRTAGRRDTASRPSLAASASSEAVSDDGDRAGGDEADRQAAVERARRRGQGNAFAAWTPDEERALLEAVEQGRDLDALAREHGRSRRALELRLERLRG